MLRDCLRAQRTAESRAVKPVCRRDRWDYQCPGAIQLDQKNTPQRQGPFGRVCGCGDQSWATLETELPGKQVGLVNCVFDTTNWIEASNVIRMSVIEIMIWRRRFIDFSPAAYEYVGNIAKTHTPTVSGRRGIIFHLTIDRTCLQRGKQWAKGN